LSRDLILLPLLVVHRETLVCGTRTRRFEFSRSGPGGAGSRRTSVGRGRGTAEAVRAGATTWTATIAELAHRLLEIPVGAAWLTAEDRRILAALRPGASERDLAAAVGLPRTTLRRRIVAMALRLDGSLRKSPDSGGPPS
jgi:hypothetical protein